MGQDQLLLKVLERKFDSTCSGFKSWYPSLFSGPCSCQAQIYPVSGPHLPGRHLGPHQLPYECACAQTGLRPTLPLWHCFRGPAHALDWTPPLRVPLSTHWGNNSRRHHMGPLQLPRERTFGQT
jgi:hypothetical protein